MYTSQLKYHIAPIIPGAAVRLMTGVCFLGNGKGDDRVEKEKIP